MRRSLILFILLLPTFTFAQFKNIRLDEATADIPVCQPGIVINKKNPNNIIAASALDNIYYTNDGGANWQSSKLKGVYGNPVLVSDEKGNIYAFHLSGEAKNSEKNLDQILCHVSRDGGKTWEQGGPVGLHAPKDQSKPRATVDSKGNVWVAWTEFDNYNSGDENCQSNVLLSYSSNGRKWSKPVQISQTPGNCKDDDNTVAGAVPAIAVDGKAFVAWANQNKIFLDRSFSGGGLWLTNDIAIGQQPGGWDMKLPGYEQCNGSPALMIDQSKSIYQGSLYLIWADQRNGETDTDVWFMRSTNFGDNWSTPVKLGDDKEKRHQYLPSMTVDISTGYLYAVFYDRGKYEDDQTDVSIAYSIDGGISFKTAKVSETPFTPLKAPSVADYTSISANKGIITPIWTRMDEGKTSVWTAIIKQADLIQLPEASNKKKRK